MVKASSIVVASLFAVGSALAFVSSYDDLDSRDLIEADLYERDLYEPFELDLREYIEAREVEEAIQFYQRDPFIGRILGGAKRFLFGRGLDIEDLSDRDVDDLIENVVARDPFIGKILGGAKRFLFGRDLEEIEAMEARSPFIGKIFRGVKNVLFGRDDLEAIEARDPFIGKILGGAKRFLFGRHIELGGSQELDARDPFIGKVFGGVKRFLFGRDGVDFETRSMDGSLDELD
ncbi:hypothetical protein CC2G_013597 [Coprinopsis cinerea AmutBmut pab1-1]|nr:hypothetical protein CC2G_013597 [Coprinopsis cinerea AmutBmut pab1-1]